MKATAPTPDRRRARLQNGSPGPRLWPSLAYDKCPIRTALTTAGINRACSRHSWTLLHAAKVLMFSFADDVIQLCGPALTSGNVARLALHLVLFNAHLTIGMSLRGFYRHIFRPDTEDILDLPQ